MAGLGQLDGLFNLAVELTNKFGGTGKIEIETITGQGGFSGAPTTTTTTFDNISITPPTNYVTDTDDTTPIASGLVETFVHLNDVTTKPISEQSYLTIYEKNPVTGVTSNGKRMKIRMVNIIMTGNQPAMYQLICGGSF